MSAKYSIKSDGKILGPDSMDALASRLSRAPVAADAEVIIHSRFGDRFAPIAAFPQLRVRGAPPRAPTPLTRCVYCETPTTRTPAGRQTCPQCGCNFEVDIVGRVYDQEGPLNESSVVTGLIGFALILVWAVGYGAHWAGAGLLILGGSGLYGALRYRVVNIREKFTEVSDPGMFSFGLCLYAGSGLLGLAILTVSVVRHVS